MKRRRIWWFPFLSALLFGLSSIEIGLGFLSFFAFVPYLIFITQATKKQSFKFGFLFGFIITCITLYGVVYSHILAFIGLLILYPLYYAVLSWLLKFVQLHFKKAFIWLFPLMWIAFEYFMTLGPLNFPWLNVGYTLTDYYYLIQFADVFGIYGLSLACLYINALIFRIPKLGMKVIALLVCIFVLWLGYGIYRDHTIILDKHNFKVGIVQLSLSQEEKWDTGLMGINFDKYEKQLQILARRDSVDLVIFPESAINTYLLHEVNLRKRIANMARANNVNLVTGFNDYRREWDGQSLKYRFYNSATLIDSFGNYHKTYNKIRLVPFGERIPLMEVLPFLKNLNFGQGTFDYGDDYTLYELDNLCFGVTICFEGAFPELNRDFVMESADFIINLTNDGWFRKSAVAREHARNYIIRAVENRIPVFRAANTGISYIVNPKGEIIAYAPLWAKQNISGFLFTTNSRATFFDNIGYLLAKICFISGILIIIYSILSDVIEKKSNKI
ncbi:MAG: apolipoprotein N-acyltransferase [Candidatus Cloacimonadia bacterium]